MPLYELVSGYVKPFKDLISAFDWSKHNFFYILQGSNYAKSCCSDKENRCKLTLIDWLLQNRSYSILDTYVSLNCYVRKPLAHSPISKWNKDFPDDILADKLIYGYNKVQKLMINELWRESEFKLLHRAFILFLSLKNDPNWLLAHYTAPVDLLLLIGFGQAHILYLPQLGQSGKLYAWGHPLLFVQRTFAMIIWLTCQTPFLREIWGSFQYPQWIYICLLDSELFSRSGLPRKLYFRCYKQTQNSHV